MSAKLSQQAAALEVEQERLIGVVDSNRTAIMAIPWVKELVDANTKLKAENKTLQGEKENISSLHRVLIGVREDLSKALAGAVRYIKSRPGRKPKDIDWIFKELIFHPPTTNKTASGSKASKQKVSKPKASLKKIAKKK